MVYYVKIVVLPKLRHELGDDICIAFCDGMLTLFRFREKFYRKITHQLSLCLIFVIYFLRAKLFSWNLLSLHGSARSCGNNYLLTNVTWCIALFLLCCFKVDIEIMSLYHVPKGIKGLIKLWTLCVRLSVCLFVSMCVFSWVCVCVRACVCVCMQIWGC